MSFLLKSSDGISFEVDKTLVHDWLIVQNVEGAFESQELTLENVTSEILTLLIAYCKKHQHQASSASSSSTASVTSKSHADELKQWDAQFMKVSLPTLFGLIKAADYIGIESLADLTCKTLADLLSDKPLSEIRKTFGLKNDFTPQEKEKVLRENNWALTDQDREDLQ
ncbi:hypothetical protein EUTSA_v10014855mg [Eutrema salsugineum]|uniref:SKP1-like protein n=1 Tax=Eutrema salsugineum TaxID=72664 RepID=V4KYL5_EUTSA|nr:hypothetical protein EUTSA_v10014855mg [Eutrema salsugineum]